MSDHYSDVRDVIRRQEREGKRKEIKSMINKLSDDELFLLEDYLNNIKLYKTFFAAIQKISKIKF
jgi:hypothetical protein